MKILLTIISTFFLNLTCLYFSFGQQVYSNLQVKSYGNNEILITQDWLANDGVYKSRLNRMMDSGGTCAYRLDKNDIDKLISGIEIFYKWHKINSNKKLTFNKLISNATIATKCDDKDTKHKVQIIYSANGGYGDKFVLFPVDSPNAIISLSKSETNAFIVDISKTYNEALQNSQDVEEMFKH